MFTLINLYIQNKKAGLEYEELGKIIIGAVILLVLIMIVMYISGEFDSQNDINKGVLDIIK